jgi:hypothetical protein
MSRRGLVIMLVGWIREIDYIQKHYLEMKRIEHHVLINNYLIPYDRITACRFYSLNLLSKHEIRGCLYGTDCSC